MGGRRFSVFEVFGVFAAFLAYTVALSCSGPDPAAIAEDTMKLTHQHHGIDYIEFTVTDMAESQRFYGEAFGWKFTDYGPEYAGIRKGDGEAGGLRLDTEIRTGGPLVVLYSEDLEATLSSVRRAGGTIVTEPFEFPGGRRFHFTDPSGNELAVWALK